MILLLLSLIYLAFISLGLPDGLLGSAWPIIHVQMGVPVSYAGIVSIIIALGTIISSLLSDKINKRLGTGFVTSISVMLTCLALFGFSFSSQFWMLCLWAIPYGIGAGGVDAALNNYVAVHYKSKHMSWLHAMWGIGAATGPYVMGYALTHTGLWNDGYLIIGFIQIFLTIILFLSLPLWKKNNTLQQENTSSLSMINILKIIGVKEVLIMFFCYCALEQTAALWASSYLVDAKNISKELAATFASFFYLGITGGRILSGFLTLRFNDKKMIYLGQGTILLGILMLLLPLGDLVNLIGLIVIGLGCAPIYPCVIHSTPELFGADKSQIIIGIEMASAYIGTLLMPALFGIIAEKISIILYPFYLLLLLMVMILIHIFLRKKYK